MPVKLPGVSASPALPRVLRTLAALVAGLVAGCVEPAGVVGTWEPADPDPALPATRTSFFEGGGARIVSRPPTGEAEAYDARYRVEGDSVLVLSDGEGEERFRLDLRADTLTLVDPSTGRARLLVRVR